MADDEVVKVVIVRHVVVVTVRVVKITERYPGLFLSRCLSLLLPLQLSSMKLIFFFVMVVLDMVVVGVALR